VSVATDQMIGRRDETALLRRRLADARAGTGHLVVVVGPAGIGKTRLLEELATDVALGAGIPGAAGAAERDVPAGSGAGAVGWGGAADGAGAPPLWPWARALRHWPEPYAAVTAVGATSGGEHGTAGDTAAAAFAADTAVVDALEAQARASGGLLVILEDLQWADQASLRLLGRVAAEIRRFPLLVVATHRDPSGGALPGQLARRASDVVRLDPLTDAESAALLTATVARPDPAALRHAVRLAGGSPLFLRTLARSAPEQLRGTRSWDTSVGESAEFRHLVAAATRTVGPDCADVVAALSVLGADADGRLLGQLTGAGVAVFDRLGPAVPAGLVQPCASGTVRFAHALVRDAVYAELPPTRRVELHRNAATLLEPAAVARDDLAGAVAQHWHRAGDPARAIGWAIRAADTARAACAYEEAIGYLELALHASVADVDTPPDRAELLLDLARAQYLAGQVLPSIDTCERAAAEGERTGRPDVVARAAIVVQGIGHRAANRQLVTLCRRALAYRGGVPTSLAARVRAQLSCALLEVDEWEEAAEQSRSALDDTADGADPYAELDAIRARAAVAWRPSLVPEMADLGRRALTVAAAVDRPLAELWAYVWLSDTAVHRGDVAAARAETAALAGLAERTGLPIVRWHLLRRRASFALLAGQFDTCRRRSAEAAEVATNWLDESVEQTAFAQSVYLAVQRGDPADITVGWTGYLAHVETFPPIAHVCLASALLVSGRSDEAKDLYAPLVGAVSDARGVSMAMIHDLAQLAVAFGDTDACRDLRDLIAARYGHSAALGAGTVYYAGAVQRMLGELSLGCGEHSVAAEQFSAGLTVDGALGARALVARGRFGLARALLPTGDARRSADLARSAAADARRLDMPGLIRDASAFLADIEAGARQADPLTAREREVATLVAQAMSNKEVAGALVLSERTVESHMRNILAKAGCTSRAELIRWMLEN
jgi:DNA-binding CsgD family transcriptional regulator